ncbi:MAG: aldose 1-epimerase family protein [Phycisphaerae bacterium]|nr:aldose 1-epimerase family protein [Phycisphaerae bacterium]
MSQVGGIETSVLDNGPARGTRIAWINTGSGLRYKVAMDRALDIADAFYNQHSLAWLSRGGLTGPRPDANHGLEWLWSFGGGLVTTCGLTHTGGPETDEFGERGLHGRISNMPAEIESIIQPDPKNGSLDMSISATVRQSRVFGPHLELKRTLSSTLGRSSIRIHDVVTNQGNTPQAHMLLYHCNFGWPLVDEGVEIVYRGPCRSYGRPGDNEIFNDTWDYKTCSKPLKRHCGTGEGCGVIDVKPDTRGLCTVGFANRALNLGVSLTYPKAALPALTNWQHWGPGEYVCALEPGTNPPMGQKGAREQGTLQILKPGESRQYTLDIEVLNDLDTINRFCKRFG